MQKFFLAAAILALGTAPAFAGDDMMGGYFGNTVVATGGIAETHSHYRADHSFDLVATAMGTTYNFKGTWAFDDKGQLCRTYVGDAPPNSPNPLCTPWEAHKVGETWTMTMGGNSRTLTLKAGVQ